MAEIYVRTTGNDTTGDGSTGAPYATIKKALSVAAAGDQIIIGTGTYAEDSGAGALSLGINPANYVYLSPESGALGDVVITGASGSYALLVAACSFLHFKNLVFRSQSASVSGVARFLGANFNNLRWVNCRFEVIGSSSQTNSAVVSAWTSGSFTVSKVAFIGCEIREIGPYPVAGFNLDNQTGTVSDIQILKCKAHLGYFPARLKGITDIQIDGADFVAFSPSVSGTCLQLGEDAATGANVTGKVLNSSFIAMTGHGAVIGAGCSDVHFDSNTVVGGSNTSNGQGLVVKNATGGRVTNNTIMGGYLSTLYLKACSGVLFEGNKVYNRYSTSSALKLAVNSENASKASRNTIRMNEFYANVGSLISWDNSSGDGGGNECDQNVYNAAGSATWGSVRGMTISSLADLKAAWSSYDRPGNDQNSRSGTKAVRHRGDRAVIAA